MRLAETGKESISSEAAAISPARSTMPPLSSPMAAMTVSKTSSSAVGTAVDCGVVDSSALQPLATTIPMISSKPRTEFRESRECNLIVETSLSERCTGWLSIHLPAEPSSDEGCGNESGVRVLPKGRRDGITSRVNTEAESAVLRAERSVHSLHSFATSGGPWPADRPMDR